jgi:Arc/MetJ-type ribon-helix-helix transcriptional regulator
MINIDLSKNIEDYAKSQVSSGKYSDINEVISKALSVMIKRKAEHIYTENEIDDAIDLGLECIEKGMFYKGTILDIIKK